MSIPHLEDLNIEQIIEILELNWTASEKLDGSFVNIGLTEEGEFYTQRKGAPVCFRLEDWPAECWASTYREVHQIAADLIDLFLEEDIIEPGDSFGAEIIDRMVTNTIKYRISNPQLAITTFSSTIVEQKIRDFTCNILKLNNSRWALYSHNGVSVSTSTRHNLWNIAPVPSIPNDLVKSKLVWIASHIRGTLIDLLNQNSAVPGLLVKDCLLLPLNRRPNQVSETEWYVVKEEVGKLRPIYQEVVDSLIASFKDVAFRGLVGDFGSCLNGRFTEGLVGVTRTGLVFKITERKEFARANRFSHIVKYWLVGGRRPARPSFLSRTKDWPAKKRLHRLSALLDRYQKHASELNGYFELNSNTMHLNHYEHLHGRNLALFADTRKRIENGR